MRVFQLLVSHLIKVDKVASYARANCSVLALLFVCSAFGQSTITVTPGANGTITPGGNFTVTNGTNQTFTIQPNSGYTLRDAVVDGSKTGVSSPWTDLGAQNDTRIRSFAYLGNGIVVASGDIIHRSTDYGATWTSIDPKVGGVNIKRLTYAGNGIVLGGASNGVIIRSTDYGLTWSSSGTLFGQTIIYGLTSIGNGLVLAGTYPGGLILRSTDYGATWTNMGELGSETNVITIETFGNGIVVAGAGNTGDIWRSTDNGLTWTNLGGQAGELDIDYIVHMGSGIAIASASRPVGKLLRSTDYGLTWTDLGQFSPSLMNNVAHMGNGVGVVGAGTGGHMYKTVDYGATWMDLGQQGGEQWISSGYLETGIFVAGTGALINQGGNSDGKILRSVASGGLGPVTTYTFTNVQTSHTITADFYLIPSGPPLPPVINSFSATPSSISSGQSATLNWNVANATKVSISPGNIESTNLAGSYSVFPTSTTTYTLTASNDVTSVTAQATVQVLGAPVLTNVAAPVSGLTVTVTWTTDQPATEQVLYGTTQSLGSVSPTGMTLQTFHKMTFYNLPRKTVYYYQAVSTNSHGQTGSSAIYSFTTSGRTNAVGGVTITPGSVRLSWDPITDPSVTRILILRARGTAAPTSATAAGRNVIAVASLGPSATSFHDENVVTGKTYSYSIFACSPDGGWSDPVSGTYTAGSGRTLVVSGHAPAGSKVIGAQILPPAAFSGLFH